MDFSHGIQENRLHHFTIRTDIPATTMTIRQTGQKFLFGSNLFGLCRKTGPQLDSYRKRISDIWNAGTLPFYWGRFEPEEGKVDAENVMAAADWAAGQGLGLKGHPLCWHTACADWLLQYDNDTIVGKQMDRIRREVSRFKGLIDTWDVINEAVIMPSFDRYDNAVSRICNHLGTVPLVMECFRAAREANPEATLLINDFDLSRDYESLITELLDRGCPIDAIGIQTHQHQGYDPPEKVADYLERFSRFGLPLHFTEITILSGTLAPEVADLNDAIQEEWPSTVEGEALQLRQVEEFYSQIYSHPSVEAMIWWDLEDGNWLNAPAGLIRRDHSPKPAYTRLRELIEEEWAFGERTLPIEQGRTILEAAPEGSYEAKIGERVFSIELNKEQAEVQL